MDGEIFEVLSGLFDYFTGSMLVHMSVVVSLISYLIYKLVLKRQEHSVKKIGLPLPGPQGLPFFGYLPFFGPRMCVSANNLRESYGDVFAVPVGMQKFVFLNSYDTIKEAFIEKPNEFPGNPALHQESMSAIWRGHLLSIRNTYMDEREEFALRIMSEYKIRRFDIEAIIIFVAQELIDEVRAAPWIAHNTKRLFRKCVVSITANFNSLLTNHYGVDQTGIQIESLNKYVVSDTKQCSVSPIVFPYFGCSSLWFVITICVGIWEIVEKIKNVFNRLMNTITTILKIESKLSRCGSSFDYQSLLMHSDCGITSNISALFRAGVDSTAAALSWTFILLAHHPDIQKRVHQEIDDVFGPSRKLKYRYIKYCHYINSLIDEVLRMSTFAPFDVQHYTKHDTTINGIFIPENTIIIPNIYAVHHDPTLWESPNEFRPQRFLNPKDGTYRESQYLINFGLHNEISHRQSLVKIQLFLIIVIFMKDLKCHIGKSVERSPEETLALDQYEDFEDYEVVFRSRRKKKVDTFRSSDDIESHK